MNIKNGIISRGYADKLDMNVFYTRDEVLKILKTSSMQLHRLRKKEGFPAPIYAKEKVSKIHRPTKAFFDKLLVNDWIRNNEFYKGRMS